MMPPSQLPDHAIGSGVTHQCQPGLHPDDRPQTKITPWDAIVQLVASARPGHGLTLLWTN